MTYHIKLRHPHDPRPTSWTNSWADDDRVSSIATFPAVADRCEEIAESGGVVRIHRLRYGVAPESICCECQVAGVTDAKDGIRVEFKICHIRNLKPPVKRIKEDGSSYEA